ncbi:MAG: radical SAM protein [Phycisphaerales bacterium]|nr:radical SAM protein [Phycisphaerales bacterium]
MKQNHLSCTLPWKALFMDMRYGRLSALPCCATWINRSYGPIEDGMSILESWNGPGAVEIRRLMIEGKQEELCAPDCPWLFSGKFAENAAEIVPGPPEFEANQRLNNQEISERKTILKSLPMALRIIPTLRCNIRCRMCFQDHKTDFRLPETFMADMRKLGKCVYDYHLQGGEVLISDQFRQWAAPDWFSENPQMLLSMTTNATKIPEQNWRVLQSLRINHITISVNAATRETYWYVAGADLFDDVMRNIKALKELSRLHRIQQFQIFLSFVIMRCNYRELPAFAHMASQLGLPFRLLLIEGDREGESIYTNPPILRDIIEVLDEAKPLSSEESIPELNRVRESLQTSLTSQTFRMNQ